MNQKTDIFKNKSYWENMNKTDLDNLVKQIFDHYRKNGFPYYPTTSKYRNKEFNNLKKYDYSKLIDNGVIKQTMHGLGLAWSYFPHAFSVKCNDKLTPYEVFYDDDMFMKVILKRLKMGTYISDSGIRKMLKMYSNTQAVSNFRPTAAAAIYDKYAPNGAVWDMSGGWGGRMLGAMISSVNKYFATEPSVKTYLGLNKLAHEFGEKSNTDCLVSYSCSEKHRSAENSYDLCFSSPPYFDLEKYADEPSQSYVKFKTKEDWIDGFLKKTFENCFFALKNNGHMLINIADPKKKNKLCLEQATIDKAKEVGFEHIDTLKLALSNPNMRNRLSAFKYEPIFVFKKF